MKKIINYIPHQLPGFYQCLQEHGISYTMKRIIEHAGIDMGTRDFHRDDRKERINHENCNCHEMLSKVLGGTQNMERTVDDNFFFFDSDTLDSVHSFFLGYTIYQGKEYNSNKRDVESVPCDAWEGCFIEVKKDVDKITIRQDFNGSWGIYTFKKDGYFAVSNSFWLLLNKIKDRYQVTLNEDYAKSMFVFDLCSLSIRETLIREINLVPRNYILLIDVKTKKINSEPIDFHEDKIPLDSPKGIETLDRWFYKWTSLIRTLKAKTNNITVDLSGGMDSRIILALLLSSYVNMNEIHVHSLDDKLHTHAEDFKIAGHIAQHFGFQLNQNKFRLSRRALTPQETMDISCNLKLGMHKEMYWKSVYDYNTMYYFTGAGGEARRKYWQMEPDDFITRLVEIGKKISDSTFHKSTERILQRSFHDILSMCTFSKIKSGVLPERLYIEARSRQHFGKAAVESFLVNNIIESPFLDVDLRSIDLEHEKDENILFAVIWQRYCPDLLLFPFEGKRSISPETIARAKRICERYPFFNKNKELINVSLTSEHTFQAENGQRYSFSPNDAMKNYFEKTEFEDYFSSRFSQEIYDIAKEHAESFSYFPLRQIYQAVATEKAIHMIDESCQSSIFSDIIKSNDDKINSVTLNYRRTYLHNIDSILHRARIDVKNIGEENDVEITLNSTVQRHDTPAWYSKNGIGHVLESEEGHLVADIICKGKGTLEIILRGIDYRTKGERLPIFIDYLVCKINEKDYFINSCPASHDAPYRISIPCSDGQKFQLKLEWDRHGYSGHEYKELLDNFFD